MAVKNFHYLYEFYGGKLNFVPFKHHLPSLEVSILNYSSLGMSREKRGLLHFIMRLQIS